MEIVVVDTQVVVGGDESRDGAEHNAEYYHTP